MAVWLSQSIVRIAVNFLFLMSESNIQIWQQYLGY